MSMLKEAFEAGKFGVTAEMAPRRVMIFLSSWRLQSSLNGKVHGVNVTDMQSASLKASSLGLCVALKNAGIEPILQMTGRDRNRMAIMGDIFVRSGLRHRHDAGSDGRPSRRRRLSGIQAGL